MRRPSLTHAPGRSRITGLTRQGMLSGAPLLGPALSMAGWALASRVADSEGVAAIAAATSLAAALSLVVSLGTPYLATSLLRPEVGRLHEARFLVLLGTLVPYSCLGLAWLLVVTGIGVPGLPLLLAITAGVALGMLEQHLARSLDRLSGVILSTAPAWLPSMTLGVLSLSGAGMSHLVLTVVAGQTLAALTPLVTIRQWLTSLKGRVVGSAASGNLNWTRRWWALRRSLYLLPHLIASAAILQEPRLVGATFADSDTLSRIQFLVLIGSIGVSVLVAVQGLLSLRLQFMDDDELRAGDGSVGRNFGLLGVFSAALIIVPGPLVDRYLFNGAAQYDQPLGLMLGLATLALGGYHLGTTLLLRAQRSFQIGANSVAVAVVSLLMILWLAPDTALNTLIVYTVTTALLMVSSWFNVWLIPTSAEDGSRASLRRYAVHALAGIALLAVSSATWTLMS